MKNFPEAAVAPADRPTPSSISVAGAIAVGTAALMILGIQPILLGALTEEHRLTLEQLGQLATAENLALAASSAVGAALMGGPRLQAKSAAACIALIVANLGIYLFPAGVALFVLRAAAGACEGLMLGSAVLILTATRHPDRINGLFLAVQTIPQMVAAYFLPVYIIPRWGANAGFGLLALTSLAALAGAALLQVAPRPPARAAAGGALTGWRVLLALLAVVVQNAGIGGAWNYVEQIGALHRFGGDTVGLALSSSLAAQVAGAFFVAWIGWRAPFRLVLPIGIAVQAAVVLVLAEPQSGPVYISAATGFGLLWLSLQPYQIRQLLTLDPTRRGALLVVPMALTGLSLGPFAVSLAALPDDISGCFRVACALLAVSAVLFYLAARRASTQSAEAPA